RVVGGGALRIAHLGHAEQHHAAEARLRGVRGGRAQRVERVLHDAGHRADRGLLGQPLTHEHRQHQLARLERGLAHQVPYRSGSAKPAQARLRKAAHGANSSAAWGRVKCDTVSISASTVCRSATAEIGRPAFRASLAVRGPMAASSVLSGMWGNCSRTWLATDPLVMRIALMRPFSTSRRMRSVTGTPTVRYATTLSTSCPASLSITERTGLAISLRRDSTRRGSGSSAII